MTKANTFAAFIMRKADKAPSGRYWTTMQILKNACLANKMPIFNGRVSSATWKRYFDLLPPGLHDMGVKVHQNYQRSVRYEKWQSAVAGRVTQKLSSQSSAR